jgi:hypothetical protein
MKSTVAQRASLLAVVAVASGALTDTTAAQPLFGRITSPAATGVAT